MITSGRIALTKGGAVFFVWFGDGQVVAYKKVSQEKRFNNHIKVIRFIERDTSPTITIDAMVQF